MKSASMKSARVNLLMSADEKTQIEARASRLKISMSELVRRAVRVYDPFMDDEQFQVLAREIAMTVDRTEAQVDRALARLDDLERMAARRAQMRAEARKALEKSGTVWPFAIKEPASKDDAA